MSEQRETRTMRVEVDLPNPKDTAHPDGVLQDGMYGQLTLYLGKTRDALTIPTAALVGAEKDEMRSVYVVRNGRAERVKVRVGLDDGIRAEALSGLKPDDRVIVRHGPGLQARVPVEITREIPPDSAEQYPGEAHEQAD
jgi:hypothetical protein